MSRSRQRRNWTPSAVPEDHPPTSNKAQATTPHMQPPEGVDIDECRANRLPGSEPKVGALGSRYKDASVDQLRCRCGRCADSVSRKNPRASKLARSRETDALRKELAKAPERDA